MDLKLTMYLLSSLISIECMLIHRSPIPLTIQYHDEPNYSFTYDVKDPRTGDIKNQQESRLGDRVTGQYTLIQPDGVRRTVDYKADDVQGFRATVSNERLEDRQTARGDARAANNWLVDCNDCVDQRNEVQRENVNPTPKRNEPIDWQIDYTTVEEVQREGRRNEVPEQTERPVQTEKIEAQLPPATSRTSIIQRVDNNLPLLNAAIPWI